MNTLSRRADPRTGPDDANLIAPVIPRHRILRSDGTLGGYYYGLPVKQWLLRHEGARD